MKKDKNIPKVMIKILDARMNNDKVWIDYSEVKESLGFAQNQKLNEALVKYDILKEMEFTPQSEAQFLKLDSKQQVISIEFEMFKKLALNRNTTQCSDQIKDNVKNIKYYLSLMDTLAIKYAVYDKMFIQCKNNRAKSICNDILMNDSDQWPQQVQIDYEQEEYKEEQMDSLSDVQSQAIVEYNESVLTQLQSPDDKIAKEMHRLKDLLGIKLDPNSELDEMKQLDRNIDPTIITKISKDKLTRGKKTESSACLYYIDSWKGKDPLKIIEKIIQVFMSIEQKLQIKQHKYYNYFLYHIFEFENGFIIIFKVGKTTEYKYRVYRPDSDTLGLKNCLFTGILSYPVHCNNDKNIKQNIWRTFGTNIYNKQASEYFMLTPNQLLYFILMTIQQVQIEQEQIIKDQQAIIEYQDQRTEYLMKQEETKQKEEETKQMAMKLLQTGVLDLDTFKKLFKL